MPKAPLPLSAADLETRLLKTLNAVRSDRSPEISGLTRLEEIMTANGIWPEVIIDLVSSIYARPEWDQSILDPNDSLTRLASRIHAAYGPGKEGAGGA